MTAQWIPSFPLQSLPLNNARVLRHGADQVAIFRLPGDAIYAVDNRCPHEGYPLSEGGVSGTVLTCLYHNFKFELTDGRCTKGAEAVRSFPLRVRDGVVEVDMSPPAPELLRPQLWASLEEAMFEYRIGQASRDATRLLHAGEDPVQLAAFAAIFDAERSEWGSTHALPVAADILTWLPRYPGLRAALPLAQALDVSASAHRRRERHPLPTATESSENIADQLHALVEAEQEEEAIAALRGSLHLGRQVLEPAFIRLCGDHFLDYGHGLIYSVKAFQLLEAAGWQHADGILTGLLRRLVNGTREDTLPAWRRWRDDMRGFVASQPAGTPLPNGFIDAVLGPVRGGFAAVNEALRLGVDHEVIARALCIAAARRLLAFDPAIDANPDIQHGWLDASHVQTFANAVRRSLSQHTDLRLLFQAARMIGATRVLDTTPLTVGPAPGDVVQLIRARESHAAMAAASHALAIDPIRLRHAIEDLVIDDVAVLPIVVAHAIKQTVAAFDDYAATGEPDCVLALVRMLSHALTQRWVVPRTREAIAFVAEGRTPRVLVH